MLLVRSGWCTRAYPRVINLRWQMLRGGKICRLHNSCSYFLPTTQPVFFTFLSQVLFELESPELFAFPFRSQTNIGRSELWDVLLALLAFFSFLFLFLSTGPDTGLACGRCRLYSTAPAAMKKSQMAQSWQLDKKLFFTTRA